MGYWTTDFLVVQRILAAKDIRSAEMAPIIGAGFKMLVPIIVIISIIGVYTAFVVSIPLLALVGGVMTPTLALEPFFMEFIAGVESELSSQSVALTIQLVEDLSDRVVHDQRPDDQTDQNPDNDIRHTSSLFAQIARRQPSPMHGRGYIRKEAF
jgi:uncharacterized sodium:solute symporter family permease YidK